MDKKVPQGLSRSGGAAAQAGPPAVVTRGTENESDRLVSTGFESARQRPRETIPVRLASDSLTEPTSRQADRLLPRDRNVGPVDLPGPNGSAGGDESSDKIKDPVPAARPDAVVTSALVQAVIRTGSSDLGTVLGQSAIGVSLPEVFGHALVVEQLQEFDRCLSHLDDRSRDIALTRLFTLDSLHTYEQIGQRWGITRERVRQVQNQLKADLEARFGAHLAQVAQPVRLLGRWVLPSDHLLEAVRLLTVGVRNEDAVVAALFAASGPWRSADGWAVHADLQEKLSEAIAAMKGMFDSNGLLPLDEAGSCLELFFVHPEHRVGYMTGVLGMTQLGSSWAMRDSQRSRVAAALREIGRPATRAEIGQLSGVDDPTRVGNVLATLAGVVRADRARWAFAEWVDDAYDGIVGEIRQRIDAHGGSVRLNVLLDELPRLFGVSESSIRTYLGTDAFVVDNEMVSHNEGDYVGRPPWSSANAVCVDGLWGQRQRLQERHFAGYSLMVSFDIAHVNGLRPGDDLRVPVLDHDGEASVIWRRHNSTRTVDVGRVSRLLVAAGYAPDDEVVVIPTREGVRILPATELRQDRVAEHPGGDSLDGEHNDNLERALRAAFERD